MPTYLADAVVLHRLDYGEADRILTLLTREHGKLAAIAKGSRGADDQLRVLSQSRLLGSANRRLEPYNVVSSSANSMSCARVIERPRAQASANGAPASCDRSRATSVS